jgi:hypothetical protein
MHKSLIIAASLATGLLGSSVHADDRGSGTIDGGVEPPAHQRQGSSAEERRGTYKQDQQRRDSQTGETGDTQTGRQDEESAGGTQHGDAPARTAAYTERLPTMPTVRQLSESDPVRRHPTPRRLAKTA